MLIIEITATIFGLIQGLLVMLNKRSNWIFYIIQMVLLVIFSIHYKLYGDVINNLIYVFLGIIGFITWNKKANKQINTCTKKEKNCYVSIIFIITLIGYFILQKTNDPLPLLDSFTTTSSLVATYYMINKKIDTWIIWFINDIFYAIEYFILPNQALYLFILNIIWAVMAIFSYISWRRIMNSEENKKVYFAGKFNLNKNKKLKLSERLKNDYRSILLGNSKYLTYYQDNLHLNKKYTYSGPFYCEQASNGDFTSTDCNTVLNSEKKAVNECDIYVAVFGEDFSVGTIVELGWALNKNKDIYILYKEEDSIYDIKSEYWFAIADALTRSKKVKVFKYTDEKQIIKIIRQELLNKNYE